MGKKSRNKNRTIPENTSLLNQRALTAQTHSSLPHKAWIYALAVAIITLAVYAPALKNDFVYWDDPKYVYENTNITNLNAGFLKWIFTFHAANWHPLTWVSHAVDYLFWGLNPIGHHLSSILLHSLNTFFLCIFVAYLIKNTRETDLLVAGTKAGIINKALIAGVVSALLFGIIPVHVESVAWVSERKDVLSTLFVLLSLIFYVRYNAENDTRRRFNYYLCLMFFVLALLSKPMAITLPAVLVLLDIYPFQRLSRTKGLKFQHGVLTEKIPFFSLSAASAVLTILAQSSGGAVGTFEAYPLSSRILVAIKALFFYLEKIFLPIGLSPYYPYPKNAVLTSIEFLIPAILVVIITIACYYAWKKGHRLFLLAWLFYVITLLPVIGIIQVGAQAAADRYTYMPSFVPLIIIGIGVASVFDKPTSVRPFPQWIRASVLSAVVVFSIIMGVMTVKQIGVWRDSLTLWSTVLSIYQSSPQPYLARSEVFMSMGKYDSALQDLGSAIKLAPDYADAYYNRATVYLKLDDYSKVVTDLNKAIQLNPSMDKAYFVRGTSLIKLEQYPQAIRDLDTFLLKAPDFVAHEGYYSRAIAHMKLNDYNKAINDLNSFLKIAPPTESAKIYMAYLERAAAYMKLGKFHESIQDSTKAIEINPKEPKGYNYKAAVYYAQNDFQKAIENFSQGITANPDSYELYGRRGSVYLKIGKNKEAIQDFQQAARLGDQRSQEFLKAKGIKW